MFKVKNKKRPEPHSTAFIVTLEHISHLFSSASTVDFEQVNVCWFYLINL